MMVADSFLTAVWAFIGLIAAALVTWIASRIWRIVREQSSDAIREVTKGDLNQLGAKVDAVITGLQALTDKQSESIATNSAEHAQFGQLFHEHEARIRALETRSLTTTVTVDQHHTEVQP